MLEGNVIDIAAIASGAALAVVFLSCICFSAWICFRMRKDEDGNWSAMKERWRRQRLKRRLTQRFKKESSDNKRRFMRTLRRPEDLPTTIATQDLENACAVCLENYEGDPCEIMIGLLAPCRHYFHFDCVWQWLETQANCPICRKEIELCERDMQAVTFSYIVNCNLKSENSVLLDGTTNPRNDDINFRREDSKRFRNNDEPIFHTNNSFVMVPTHIVMPPVES